MTNHIGIHPMALARFPQLKDWEAVKEIRRRIGSEDPAAYFIRRFSEGVGRIAAAFYPRPVIVRTSDFKTNEYAKPAGGAEFEPAEENPMIGYRGASRYYHPGYAAGFGLECLALARVRQEMGLTNVKVMIPFCAPWKKPGESSRPSARTACGKGKGDSKSMACARSR